VGRGATRRRATPTNPLAPTSRSDTLEGSGTPLLGAPPTRKLFTAAKLPFARAFTAWISSDVIGSTPVKPRKRGVVAAVSVSISVAHRSAP
jgi:hypothetical protein